MVNRAILKYWESPGSPMLGQTGREKAVYGPTQTPRLSDVSNVWNFFGVQDGGPDVSDVWNPLDVQHGSQDHGTNTGHVHPIAGHAHSRTAANREQNWPHTGGTRGLGGHWHSLVQQEVCWLHRPLELG